MPLVSACSSVSNPTEVNRDVATILGIGDSILEWNRAEGTSIIDVVGASLNRPVYSVAVGGARFAHLDELAAADGFDIRSQYEQVGRTDFDWVVLNGGANDLLGDCGCQECESALDELIDAEGADGHIVDFVAELAAGETKVVFIGPYQMPENAAFGYDGCQASFAEQNRRLALMAESIDGVFVVSAADVVTPEDLDAYADDRVHPSERGSRLIGESVAAAIVGAENAEGADVSTES